MLLTAPAAGRRGGWRGCGGWGRLCGAGCSGCSTSSSSARLPGGKRVREAGEIRRRWGGPGGRGGQTRSVLRNRTIWLLSAAFAFFNIAILGFATFLPTFVDAQHGLRWARLPCWPASPRSSPSFRAGPRGILSDRMGSRRRPYLAGLASTAVLLPFAVTERGAAWWRCWCWWACRRARFRPTSSRRRYFSTAERHLLKAAHGRRGDARWTVWGCWSTRARRVQAVDRRRCGRSVMRRALEQVFG